MKPYWLAFLALPAFADSGPIYGFAGGFIHENACYVGSLAAKQPESIVKVAAGCWLGGKADDLFETDWAAPDELMYRSLVVLSFADVAQTASLADQGYAEANPVWGKNPDLATMVIAKSAALYGVGWYVQRHPKQRRGLLVAALLITAACVGHNASVGVSVEF